jgi:hypothetical protein
MLCSSTRLRPMDSFIGLIESSICNPVEIVGSLLTLLTDKEARVISARYGLQGQQIRTLANLGVELGVTRERIRQIQSHALKKMQRNAIHTDISKMHSEVMKFVLHHGGIVTESEMAEFLRLNFTDLNDNVEELVLASVLDDRLVQEHNKVDFVPHFRLSSIKIAQIKKTSELSLKLLKKFNATMEQEMLLQEIVKNSKESYLHFLPQTIASNLLLDRRLVFKNAKYSLETWRHVNPRTLYDKIVFVLNDITEPMHFLDIVNSITAHSFDMKKVSLQAVHNELISNPAFVLIGRGIYALKAWGYKEGTVSDVLESVLGKKGAMNLSDLTKEVLKLRKVKPITIQINLSSKKNKFRKNREGLYELV